MGRKTYESLPNNFYLGNRMIIVLTTQENYQPKHDNVKVRNSVDGVMQLLNRMWNTDHVYICGGGKIYEQFIGYADFLLLTRVDTAISDADVYFPPIQIGSWHLMTSRPQTEFTSGYTYYFETYKRV